MLKIFVGIIPFLLENLDVFFDTLWLLCPRDMLFHLNNLLYIVKVALLKCRRSKDRLLYMGLSLATNIEKY